jgi:predicted transposase/invertase (TIGR01784 family)
MDVLAESNPEELVEVYKKMEIAKISEGNKAFLMDVVKKLEIDKKLIEEGRLEGKIEDAKNLLNLGVSVDIIIKATGLSEEEVLKL